MQTKQNKKEQKEKREVRVFTFTGASSLKELGSHVRYFFPLYEKG